jgi:hypothetical protein
LDPIFAAIADVIRALFTSQSNVALTISMAVNVALAWFIVRSRAEDRKDRQSFIDMLGQINHTLTEFRIVVAAALRRDDV